MARRRNLVIVRAGDTSLHEQWLDGDAERNWDLIVNYFGDDPQCYRRDDVRRIDSKSQKWLALHDLIQKLDEEVFCYDHIWLPDDDLRATKDGINLLFEIFAKHSLALAQPALTPDSHISHLITLRSKSFQLRFTNFVEIMAPCFSRDCLKQLLPSFNENQSGWGLDFIWPTRIADWKRIGIIDAVTVCHTRPLNGPNYPFLANKGKDARQEMAELLIKYGVTPQQPFVRGSDRKLSIYDATARDLIDRIVIGYLPELANYSDALMHFVRPNLNHLTPSETTSAPAFAALRAS
jgi:hypothetical protein